MRLPLLAQTTMEEKIAIFRQMGSRLQEPDPSTSWKVLVVALLLILTALLTWVLYNLQRRWQNQFASPQPMRLYLRTLRILGVPTPDICRLWLLARRMQIRHPTALLISSAFFDKAVTDDCCDDHGQVIRPARRQRLMTIRAMLFSQSMPSPT
jgi:hypothetical protein